MIFAAKYNNMVQHARVMETKLLMPDEMIEEKS